MKKHMMKIVFVLVMALMVITGCTESQAGQKAKVISLCKQNMDVPEEICGCIGDEAQTTLMSDIERDMLIAILSDDQKTAKRLRDTLPVDGKMRVGMFMLTAPNNCAKKKFETEQ